MKKELYGIPFSIVDLYYDYIVPKVSGRFIIEPLRKEKKPEPPRKEYRARWSGGKYIYEEVKRKDSIINY